MIAAVNEVLKGRPLNVVACEFNIDRMTLKRYCRKKKLNPNESFKSNYDNKHNNKHIINFLQQKMKKVHQVFYYLHHK